MGREAVFRILKKTAPTPIKTLVFTKFSINPSLIIFAKYQYKIRF